MKAFIEEFGLIAVALIVVLLLAAASTGVGNSILAGINSAITQITNLI